MGAVSTALIALSETFLKLAPSVNTAVSGRWCFPPDLFQHHEKFRSGIGYGSYDEAVSLLREHLRGRDYIIGNSFFSALDLYYSALLLHFSRNMQVLDADPVFAAYIERHTARLAFAETMAWAQQTAVQLGE